MMIVAILLTSILRYISSQINYSFNRINREKSFQVAEAGIYWYRWYLAHQVSGKTVQQVKDFWQNGNPYGVSSPYEAEFSDPEAGPVGKYKIEIDPPDSNSTIIMVKSTGWTYKDPGNKRTIQVRFRRPSWSENAVVANDVIRFGESTEVSGKIHSNNGIRFDGVAYNKISSSVDDYDDPDHSGLPEFGVHTHVNVPPGSGVNDNFRPLEAPPTDPVPSRVDVFKAGRQFPVPSVDFNGLLSDLNFMKSQSKIAGQGNYFDNTNCSGSNYGRHIILSGGNMTVKTVTSYDASSNSIISEGCSANYGIPNGGVIFVENNIWLEGTINNKKVTIVAANLVGGSRANVYLGANNLLYTNTDGKDVIGVIAQQDIEIIRDSQDFLTIDAALLAQSGRVGREHYGVYCTQYNRRGSCLNWVTDHKNTITVNGSIATNLRYGFAYTDNTGYTNRVLNFDNNLLYYPPPYFPTGTEYSIDLWEEL